MFKSLIENLLLKFSYFIKRLMINKILIKSPEEKIIKFDLFRSIFFQSLPIIFTVGITYCTYNKLTPIHKKIFLLICLFVIIISIFNIWNEHIKRDFIEALYKAKDQEIRYKDILQNTNMLKEELFKNSVWSAYSLKIVNTIIDFINSNKKNNEIEFRKLIKENIIKKINEVK